MFSHKSLLSSSRIPLWRILVMLVALSGLSACSVLGLNAPWDRDRHPDFELIAGNLVNSIAQVPHLSPQLATVQIGKSESSFERHINDELQARGYKLEIVRGERGLNQVKSAIKRIRSEAGEQKLYVLSIGKISVERSYDIVANTTVPTSEQVFRGLAERTVSLNDDIFAVPDSSFSAVAFKPYEGPQIEDVLSAPGAQEKAAWWKRNKQNAVKRNLYETMISNYRDVFSGYEDVEQSVLIFPNDSLRLGDTNKLIIDHYVSRMDPDTDVLSVIGCSHGKTQISNGNSLLALGRANRVKEAFLFSGLEHDQVLDEGCWAPQTFDEVMPRRGVVLTLKRKKNS